jgi:large subunit ribosomal protein L3
MNLQGLIGKKTYQSQGFLQDGTRVPLSAVSVLDNLVSQVKTVDKDGYNSVQIGFGIKKKPNKALTGHGKKAGLEKTPRFLKEIRVDDLTGLELGAKIDINAVFKPGDIIDVTGVSKGKGFAGGVKRWHFKGGPRTHGQSDRERAPGSIGQTTTPGRVYKGKKMAGKMGDTTATVRNLEVIEIAADGVILINGLIPGPKGAIVVIKKVGENKNFVPLYKEVIEEKVEPVQEQPVEAQVVEEKVEEQASVSEPASLSGNQSTTSETKTELNETLVSDSPQDDSVSVAGEDVKEKKEEVKDNANS